MLKKLEKKKIIDPWMFFIDFKGAYNGINHEILFQKLNKRGLDGGTTNLLKFYINTLAFQEDNKI